MFDDVISGERKRTFRFMFGSRIDSNTTKSKYNEACLESPSILPPTSGYPRIPQNTPILHKNTLRGTVNIPERPRNNEKLSKS
jgi:hypothetical protein